MSVKTNIGWTQATWNPWTGCKAVSPGCDNCYAEALAERMRGTAAFPQGFDLTYRPHRLEDPLRWKEPREIFVNSMSDVFFGQVSTDSLKDMWAVMEQADWHVFQVLTKRPGFAKSLIRTIPLSLPPHIWLGVSVENQETAFDRIQTLLEIPAQVRFLSCEPLLGPIDLSPYLKLGGIHWVIDGGESGRGRRPASPGWFRGIRDACLEHGVPYFHKQGNHFRPGQDRLLDGREWDGHPNRGGTG